MQPKQRLVVIGNGMSGARFVEEVLARKGSELFEIVIFGDEPYGNYNRILLSGVLAGAYDPKDIFINPLDWYNRQNITLHAGRSVTDINFEQKMVYSTDRKVEPYDKLVLATGSKPFVPELSNLYSNKGTYKNGVFVFRTLDDCNAMIKYVPLARKVAVIGGGILGLEAAYAMLNRGREVHLCHVMPCLMNVQLDQHASDILRNILVKMGIQVHLEMQTAGLLGEETISGLIFQDGTQMACDMLIIAAGVRPNIQLAQKAGLDVERGIIVHDDLSSSRSDVYALGECIQHRGRTYGLVSPLWEQARTLADQLTNAAEKRPYTGSRESTTLKVAGVELVVMGEKEGIQEQDEVVTYAEPARGIYKKLIVREDRLAGAILLGNAPTAPRLRQIFDRNELLPENRAELFFPLTTEGTQTFNVAELPESAQICKCNGVSKGEIIAAIKAGKQSLNLLCDATHAGTGCRSCRPQMEALLELVADGMILDDPACHYYIPGVPFPKSQLIAEIKARKLRSVSAVLRELANGEEGPDSRSRLSSLLKTIWGNKPRRRYRRDRIYRLSSTCLPP